MSMLRVRVRQPVQLRVPPPKPPKRKVWKGEKNLKVNPTFSMDPMNRTFHTLSVTRAAWKPHIPWTPPPGGVEEEQR